MPKKRSPRRGTPKKDYVEKIIEEDGYENLVLGNFKGPTLAVEELCVANPWDADTPEVYIVIDFERDFISCTDTGLGMKKDDPDADIQAFFSAGRKKGFTRPKETPGGRKRIGKFGTATESLFCMTHEFDLTSRRGGIESHVHEVFKPGELLKPGRRLPLTKKEISQKLHGTELVMRRLKFPQRKLSIPYLTKRIQQNFDLSPDFRVFVNQKEIQPFSVGKSTRYVFERQGEHMGQISGTIYITDEPTSDKGFYIKINTRSHGDAQALLGEITENISFSLRSNAIIVVTADGLEDAILPDRTDIDHGHLGVMELKDLIEKELGQIRKGSGRQRLDRTQALISGRERLAREARYELVRAEIEPEGVRVNLSKGKEDGSTATRDSKTCTYTLNLRSPLLRITPSMTSSLLRDRMILAMCEAKAGQETDDPAELLKLRDQYLSKITEAILAKEPPLPKIHDTKVYKPFELSRFCKWKLKTIQTMINAGVLPAEPDGVIGNVFREHEARLSGLTGINDFAVAHGPSGSQVHAEQRAQRFFEEAGDSRYPFAYDLSKTDEPCYVLESTCQTLLLRTLKRFDRRRASSKSPSSLLTTLGDEMLTMTEFAHRLDDYNAEKAKRARGYAKEHKIPIVTGKVARPRGKSLTTYRLGDLVYATQCQRGNESVALPYQGQTTE
jgi:hypothetical protein